MHVQIHDTTAFNSSSKEFVILSIITRVRAGLLSLQMTSNLYAVPLSKRPPPGVLDYIHAAVFNTFFGLAMLSVHVLQLFNLIFIISPSTSRIYNKCVNWHKDVSPKITLICATCVGGHAVHYVTMQYTEVILQLYARTLVLISSIWAPTVLRITVDPDDESLNLHKIVHRDENGIVVGIDLPDRMVLMANHQVGNYLSLVFKGLFS